ncbi:hypothetical protein GCM10029963_53490 [Micromonospora andamanensis]|uniref:hypothetical protein n=1 Tax=Micromonospora andamanensis TaxID=1287068 RepID=UPI00195007FC|nr:hypothetical protein [Micromonospora andamanensis]GIJ36710.1 hypothetical protein Vwe01_00350 [Micromonospora andamanensis]
MPSAKPRAHTSLGLEIWAVGTYEEITHLRAQLGAAGRLVEVGDPHVLAGADAGRYRQYLRAHVRTSEGSP